MSSTRIQEKLRRCRRIRKVVFLAQGLGGLRVAIQKGYMKGLPDEALGDMVSLPFGA